jgi:hypothetical protein
MLKSPCLFEKSIREIIASDDVQKITLFLSELQFETLTISKIINSQDFQLQVFQNFSFYHSLLIDFLLYLLKNYQDQYTKFEKLLID